MRCEENFPLNVQHHTNEKFYVLFESTEQFIDQIVGNLIRKGGGETKILDDRCGRREGP